MYNNKKEYVNPIFDMYRCNVLKLGEYEHGLYASRDEYERKGFSGKIKSVKKVIEDFEKKYSFKKYMVK